MQQAQPQRRSRGRLIVVLVVAVVVVGLVVAAVFTRGFGLFPEKTEILPRAGTSPSPVAAPDTVTQPATPQPDLYDWANPEFQKTAMAYVAHLDSVQKAETEAREKTLQDSIKAAKLAALPAKVSALARQVAKLEKGRNQPRPVTVAPAKPLPAGEPTGAPVATAAPTVAEEKHEVAVTADAAFVKFGVVANGVWTEYNPGTKLELCPGDYAINADTGSGVWAFDSQSLATGKPNFVVMVNGVSILGPGKDNSVGGANGYFRLNPDGSITPL